MARMKLPRFSLLVTILAMMCSWFAFKKSEAQHQWEIVDQIWQCGAVAFHDHYFAPPTKRLQWMIDAFGVDFCCDVVEVKAASRINDAELEQIIRLLKDLPKLED